MTLSRSDIRKSIRRVAASLRSDWDPIFHGRYDDLPTDEYDSCAPSVVGLIQTGASDYALAEHLHELERDVIGVAPRDIGELLPIAAKLRVAATG